MLLFAPPYAKSSMQKSEKILLDLLFLKVIRDYAMQKETSLC
jgi:hypothetical protein